MSEMALTADEVIIIGKGRLIAQRPVSDLLDESTQRFVRVRSPQRDTLVSAIEDSGASAIVEIDGSITVRGMEAAAIGDLAASLPVALHELATQAGSLEEAYMELTESSVEYQGGAVPAMAGGNA